MTAWLAQIGTALLALVVLLAMVPLVSAAVQAWLAAAHRRGYGHHAGAWTPRVAVLIPAWNEAAVLPATLARLTGMDYPPDRLRIYVIDDASTDDTRSVVAAAVDAYGDRVRYLHREHGGQGKSHTINHGLAAALADPWTEAVLITDADVLFTPDALRRLTRHLADPQVGAVTAYIKEGSDPDSSLNRFIAFEYASAQAVSRRAQNVLGFQACLAGGAQLHSRENLERIGGRIDTSTLAEDTVTTFDTQLAGHRVVFEPYAVVWAEEPHTLQALWAQRLRWGRGNLQLTRKFRSVWFARGGQTPLSGIGFGIGWFAFLLQPLLLIAASFALLTLYLVGEDWVWSLFRGLWITNGIVYLTVIGSVWAADPATLRRTWLQAALFPGVISFALILLSLFPATALAGVSGLAVRTGLDPTAVVQVVVVCAYAWLSLSMLVAYLGKLAEPLPVVGRPLALLCLWVGGYGSLCCATVVAAYVDHLRGRRVAWAKTPKLGNVSEGAHA